MPNDLYIRDAEGEYRPASNDHIISSARSALRRKFRKGHHCDSAVAVREYLSTELAMERNEVFCVLFLTSQHHVIRFERLFHGTIDAAAVYPRVVVEKALETGSSAVILAHNHPSGVAEPSQADRRITERLQKALELIDVRVLDHFVIGAEDIVSFAERGWL